jgi:hypothetical protein
MRVLFFAGGPRYYLRQYGPLVDELARRSHEVTLAFQASKGALPEVETPPGVRLEFAPGRPPDDPWLSVAWLVRGLADLARYAHPRYEHAPLLRERMRTKIVGHLEKSRDLDPLTRRAALALARRLSGGPDLRLSERVIRVAATLEEAIPTSPTIDDYVRERAPDVVLATPVVNRASTQVEFLKSARLLRVPAAVCVASWDNLTNKGLIRFVPERVLVWNEVQRREAVELHGVPPSRVVATGAQLFDAWFDRRPTLTRAELARKVGLDPSRPYVLYTCSNPAMTDVPERRFVVEWASALRGGGDERLRRLGILVRPHPNEPEPWSDGELRGLENVAVWPPRGTSPLTEEARADFFDSLVHSEAVIGINTTAMIEAAIVGKSVLTVLAPAFAQESTLHFRYLLEENGGFLHVASSLSEHVEQLSRVLDEDAAGAERRRRFVASFVRPHGLDRPATPILADAVEELATLPVQAAPRRLGRRAALGAWLAVGRIAAAADATATHASLRRLRRGVGGRVRRLGLLSARR